MSSRTLSLADIPGLKVTVMGLGLNGGGLESARFFASHGAEVTVTDLRDEKVLRPSMLALATWPIRYVLGRHEMPDFAGADIVIKNPAVKPTSPYLKAARRIESDISVFLGLSESPVIAITGSKGKSTTVSAIKHGFDSAGMKSLLGGNITVSPLSFLGETGPDIPVTLELSSWQLADLKGLGVLKPRISAITSIMPDHQNYYGSMEAYVADKRIIYAEQGKGDFTLCSRDDGWGLSFASETPAKPVFFSGATLPGGMDGAFLDGREGFFRSGASKVPIVPSELLVPGGHQKRNLLVAGAALYLYGVAPSAIAPAMASFPGVEHRLEFFAERDGVRCYNDSAATIPEAVAAAIEAFDRPLVLITGGTDKDLDFSPLSAQVEKPKDIILIAGSGTDKLIPILRSAGRLFRGPFDSLEKAVDEAFASAKPGDAILLSPGCTSFGMFLNEFDRGTKFKNLVLSR